MLPAPVLGLETRASLGDFQTPSEFTDRLCAFLAAEGYSPTILLEPTVGVGNFVFSALKYFPRLRYIYAVDSQDRYEAELRARWVDFQTSSSREVELEFYLGNIFTHAFSPRFLEAITAPDSSLLVLGNPPWVTNAELSRLGSSNLPAKSNIKNVKGLQARTGKSNFDISESILLRVFQAISPHGGQVAMLLKTTVIHNFVRDLPEMHLSLSRMRALSFDAKKEFSIHASVSFFLATIGGEAELQCTSRSLDAPKSPAPKQFGYVGRQFVSDVAAYRESQYIDGVSPFVWRQGIKHDATKVMILDHVAGPTFTNGLGERVDLEPGLIFPFVKGSTLAKNRVIQDTPSRVIVTQTKLGEDTSAIAERCPQLWAYMLSHGAVLDARKSSMYHGKPRFSIFGVGPYAFRPYKVGIGSFYKIPTFCLCLPVEGKPVMLDDTSYFLGFEEKLPAFFSWAVLSLPQVQVFLRSIAFTDAKRPYSKEVLMRLDLSRLLDQITYGEFLVFYESTLQDAFPLAFGEGDWDHFRASIESMPA